MGLLYFIYLFIFKFLLIFYYKTMAFELHEWHKLLTIFLNILLHTHIFTSRAPTNRLINVQKLQCQSLKNTLWLEFSSNRPWHLSLVPMTYKTFLIKMWHCFKTLSIKFHPPVIIYEHSLVTSVITITSHFLKDAWKWGHGTAAIVLFWPKVTENTQMTAPSSQLIINTPNNVCLSICASVDIKSFL